MKPTPRVTRAPWLLLGLLLGSNASAAAPLRPNILFIMSDDHAAHALSCYGSQVNQTPNLDRIASSGMLFTRCFVNNSICTPSRAAILTGKYSHLNGVTVFNRFDGSQPNVAKYLQQAGYQTAIIGKWHLFSDPTGFDYWNVLPGQGRYRDPVMIEMGKTNVIKGYVTDIITDLSIDWLKKRDPNKPFFLCSQPKAPHREWTPDPKHTNLYENIELPYPVTFDDDYRGRSSAAAEATMRMRDLKKTDLKQPVPPGLSQEAEKKWRYQRYIKDYLRCIASVDENVGRLLDYLEQSGLRTNTLVIYTSDQGFFLGDHGWFDKRFMYEESLRMPFLASFPGRIRPQTTNEAMILNIDFAPTFLDLAGTAIPADMQGRSLAPLLQGPTPADWRSSMYYRYYHYPKDHRVQPHYGVRTDRYKLIYFDRIDQWELYDLQSDPHETNNVYASPAQAETVKTLKAELARLKKEVKDDDQFANLLSTGETLKPVPLELVLHYDFAHIEAGTVQDQSGKRHEGRLREAMAVPGRKTRALRFDGQGQVTIAPVPDTLSPARKAFTVGAWCKPELPDGVLISLGGGAQGFSLYLKQGFPHFAIRSGGELFTARGTNAVTLNQWVHLAGTLQDNEEARVFVDGKPGHPEKAQAIETKPREGLTIGSDPGSRVGEYDSALPWRGLIEDVRIYWSQLDPDALEEWSAQ